MAIIGKNTVSNQAREFVKNNVSLLVDKFADIEKYPSRDHPFSMFMAGSPGAGKTEFSKALIGESDDFQYAVRIDADEIRGIVPQYTKNNSVEIQSAASLGVEKLYDHVLKYRQNVIVDGTFANYKLAHSNVKRSLDKGREVGIFYIYQDPIVAWEFTLKREKLEGRPIPKEAFINSFFLAKENVNKIKGDFRDNVKVYLIVKNKIDNSIDGRYVINVDNIDNFIKQEYTVDSLRSKL